MTIERRIINNAAICKARVAANSTITISAKDLKGSELSKGDEVLVRLTRTDIGSEIKLRDSDIFETTIQKTGQIHIPTSTREKLQIGKGDIVQYIVLDKSSFPSIDSGPIRDRGFGQSDAEATQKTERSSRETNNSSFSGSKMQQTGQITIPSDIMDKMGLVQGDVVFVTIRWKGDSKNLNLSIGTGNRITIPKDARADLGLVPGDKPEVELAVFD